MTFGTIEQAVEDLKNGKLVIVADDEDRENEGDLVCAAELFTPEMVNFMALHGRGLSAASSSGCPRWRSATPKSRRRRSP
jgi:3,4-dihydroxy-2-butanone 4-phosphate synthase